MQPDWEALERDVVERIRALAAVSRAADVSGELGAKVRDELVFPNVELLARFCAAVQLEESDDGTY